MPNRQKKSTKRPNDAKKSASVSSKPPTKPEDPVATFLARLGGKKQGEALNPAQRREVARREARMSSISAAKAPEREPKKK
jgi:hypothetical protein